MSEPDLVSRLRAYSDQLGGITDEAADEIERLRAIEKNLESLQKCVNIDDRIKMQRLLQNGCKHIVIENEDSEAVCGLCGKAFGWYCQISSTSVCDYYDDELCIYCGAPEERQ